MALEPGRKLPIAEYCKCWRRSFLYPPVWGSGVLTVRSLASPIAPGSGDLVHDLAVGAVVGPRRVQAMLVRTIEAEGLRLLHHIED